MLPIHFLQGSFQLFTRRRQVLKQLHLVIEVDDEGFVFVFAEDVLDEFEAGVAFTIENPGLAAAGIDEQTERKRDVALL